MIDAAPLIEAILAANPALERASVQREFSSAVLDSCRALFGEGAVFSLDKDQVFFTIQIKAVVSNPNKEIPLAKLLRLSLIRDLEDGDELSFLIHPTSKELLHEITAQLGAGWVGDIDWEALSASIEEQYRGILLRYLPHLSRRKKLDLASLLRSL